MYNFKLENGKSYLLRYKRSAVTFTYDPEYGFYDVLKNKKGIGGSVIFKDLPGFIEHYTNHTGKYFLQCIDDKIVLVDTLKK